MPRRDPWKWLIPGGCLLTLLVCGGGLVAPFYVKYRALTGSDLYEQALRELNNSDEVTGLLGDPVESPSGWQFWRFQGNLHGEGGATFPIRGPRGSGTASVAALSTQDSWTIQTLSVEVEGHGTVSIIPQ